VHSESISHDDDVDGIVDFDEVYRFGTDANMKDTDFDQVTDYDEVHSDTFSRGAMTFSALFDDGDPDVDGDGPRTFLDCDSDEDGDHDGGEDVDGNGGHLDAPSGLGAGETDVYDQTSHDFGVSLDAVKYVLGDAVYMMGGTLAASYEYETPTLPEPLEPNDAFNADHTVMTDSQGIIEADSKVFLCLQAGSYITHLDRANDRVWQSGPTEGTSRACDQAWEFRCDPCSVPDMLVGDFFKPDDPNPVDVGVQIAAVLNHSLLEAGEARQNPELAETFFEVVIPEVPGEGTAWWVELVLASSGLPSGDASFIPQAVGGSLYIQFQPAIGSATGAAEMLVFDSEAGYWDAAPTLVTEAVSLSARLDDGDLLITVAIQAFVPPGGVEPVRFEGLRVITTGGANAVHDAMPEPDFGTGSAVFDEFIDLLSCDPVIVIDL